MFISDGLESYLFSPTPKRWENNFKMLILRLANASFLLIQSIATASESLSLWLHRQWTSPPTSEFFCTVFWISGDATFVDWLRQWQVHLDTLFASRWQVLEHRNLALFRPRVPEFLVALKQRFLSTFEFIHVHGPTIVHRILCHQAIWATQTFSLTPDRIWVGYQSNLCGQFKEIMEWSNDRCYRKTTLRKNTIQLWCRVTSVMSFHSKLKSHHYYHQLFFCS